MNEAIHDYVLRKLNEQMGSWPAVSKKAGVPYKTVKNIASTRTKNPRIDTLEKLAAYFRGLEQPSPLAKAS